VNPPVIARVTTASPEETEALGARWGAHLRPGMMICLRGDLGAGKTVLASGILRGAGAPGPFRSPTFTLVWEHRGQFDLYHVDLYRLSSAEAIEDLPWDAMISERASAVIEWADRLPDSMRTPDRLEVFLSRPDDSPLGREVRAEGYGECRRLISEAGE